MRIEDGFFYYNDSTGLEQWVKPSCPVDHWEDSWPENVTKFELILNDVFLETDRGNKFAFKNYKDSKNCYIELRG